MLRSHASLIEAGDHILGAGRVATVQHFPNDPRWSAKVTWEDDGSSTLYGPRDRVQIIKD